MYLYENFNNPNKEYVDNMQKVITESPVIKFESYVPDDFVYAPQAGLYFIYTITSPTTGENMSSFDFEEEIEYYMGYSIAGDDGNNYWTYNYYIESEGTWYPAMYPYQLPQTYFEPYDVKLQKVYRDTSNGNINIDIKIKTNYPEYSFLFNEDSGKYEIFDLPPFFMDGDNSIEFWVNDEEYEGNISINEFNDLINTELLLYDAYLSFPNVEVVKKEKMFDWSKISLEVGWDQYLGKTFDVRYEISRNQSLTTTVGGEILNPVKNQEGIFSIPKIGVDDYYLRFDGSLVEEVDIPYLWNDGEIVSSERITFKKLFDNSYKYPETTKDLLEISYTDGLNTALPSNEISTKAKVKINDYDEYEINIKKRYDGNKLIIYSDEPMYYDYINEEVKIGNSSGAFLQEQGVVLPWDESSIGEISFEFYINSKSPRTFHLKLPIGSTNKLRGINGKYQIVEVVK